MQDSSHIDDAQLMTSAGLSTPAAEAARRQCEDHIVKFYPLHTQINLLRTGEPEAVSTMGTFIDACRAWSNGEAPSLVDLLEIQP